MLKEAKIKLKLKAQLAAGDIEKLPFQNDSFDLVTSTGVLSSFTNPTPALSEIIRVTRKNGQIKILDLGMVKKKSFRLGLVQKLFLLANDHIHDYQKLFAQQGQKCQSKKVGMDGIFQLFIIKVKK